MGGSTLKLGLGVCALFAFTPVLTWVYGFFFDDRWRETLGSLAVTLPIGLGVAALVLAVHGLLVNRDIAEIMAEDLEVALESATAPVPSAVSAGVTAGISGTSARTATSRAPTRTEAPADDDGAPAKGKKKPGKAGKAGKLAKRSGKRGARKIKSRGTSMIRREMRSRGPRL